MNIYITLDYELYFGKNPGTVEKCILYPTEELISIGEKHHVNFCFFADIGFLLKLKKYQSKYPKLQHDYERIVTQLKELVNKGHDVQLHIHPHWEDSYYNGKQWIMEVKRYKLTDFNDADLSTIVSRYRKELLEITGKRIFAYRAGGWCLQPFNRLKRIFQENGITLDSSVFRNGHYHSENYDYDFRNSPDKDLYRFDDNPVKEVPGGYFIELPISSIRNSPLFFWKLFLLGRKNPYLHKPLGDGVPMAAPGQRRKILTQYTHNPVSIDGYNVQLLNKALKTLINEKRNHMVIIGHPKALSRYSIQKLDEFIGKHKEKHNFTTFAKQFIHI